MARRPAQERLMSPGRRPPAAHLKSEEASPGTLRTRWPGGGGGGYPAAPFPQTPIPSISNTITLTVMVQKVRSSPPPLQGLQPQAGGPSASKVDGAGTGPARSAGRSRTSRRPPVQFAGFERYRSRGIRCPESVLAVFQGPRAIVCIIVPHAGAWTAGGWLDGSTSRPRAFDESWQTPPGRPPEK